MHFRAVKRPGGDGSAGVAADGEDVAREAQAELRSDRGRVAKRVDGEANQDVIRAAFRDEGFQRLLVHVVLEVRLRNANVDDLVHAGAVQVERTWVGPDRSDGERALDSMAGGDQLVGYVAHLAARVLGDHQHAHFSRSLMMTAIWLAISLGLPFNMWAPSPFGGVNMRRTR